MDAAIEIIAHKGLDGFTLNEVGEAAGYSRGLPVHYYGTKENLLGLVAQQLIQSYLAAQEQSLSEPAGLPRLVSSIRRYCGMPISSRTIALRLLIANAPVHPLLHDVVSQLNTAGLDWLSQQIQAGIAAGNVRTDVDVQATALMVYSFLRGLRGFRTQSDAPRQAMAVEVFVAAVTAYLAVPDLGGAAPASRTKRTASRPPAKKSRRAA